MIAELDLEYIRMRPWKAVSRLMSHLLFQGRPLTTRGRSINPILFTQFALVKQLPQLAKVEKPIFILGIGRSGTTILGKVLSLHPDTLFLNEPKALWHAVFPEEDLIGSYTRGVARYRLGAEDVTPDMREAAHRLYGYCLALTKSRRILDKYPEMIFRVPLLLSIFPDAKLVFLVRNGWDTARSIAGWSQNARERIGGEVHDWWGADRRKWRLLVEQVVSTDPAFSQARTEIAELTSQAHMAAVEWGATMREGLRLLQSIPESMHLICYEDVTAHPAEIMEKLMTFCELPCDELVLAYARRVLVPPSPKEPFPMPSAIEALFSQTMRELGY